MLCSCCLVWVWSGGRLLNVHVMWRMCVAAAAVFGGSVVVLERMWIVYKETKEDLIGRWQRTPSVVEGPLLLSVEESR